jgi:hypothetical protein
MMIIFTCHIVKIAWWNGRKKTRFIYKGGKIMMLSTGLLLSAGATVVVAVADKILDESGYQWLGTFLRIALPLGAMAASVYFLETNAILGWLR